MVACVSGCWWSRFSAFRFWCLFWFALRLLCGGWHAGFWVCLMVAPFVRGWYNIAFGVVFCWCGGFRVVGFGLCWGGYE